MDPVTVAPRVIGWLPIIALAISGLAAIAWAGTRRRRKPGSGPRMAAALPFLLLFVAAGTAVASALAEAAIDSRAGIREASMAGLATLLATPAVGWLVARLRWGAPGSRTFYQQIAANRAGATVLLMVLGELLALMGFVIGASIGVLAGAAIAGGFIGAVVAVVGSIIAALIGIRRGATILLDAVEAREAGPELQQLRNIVTEMALAANLPAPRVYVIHDPAPNAMALGSDPRHAAIAVTTGLLQHLDREELQGVVAHELAHVRNLDSRYGMLVAVFVGAVILLAAIFAEFMSNWEIGGDGIAGIVVSLLVVVAAALIGWMVRILATLAATAIQASVSREREFLADASSVEITRNPAGLIGALAKLNGQAANAGVTENTRHLWIVSPLGAANARSEGWLATHPSNEERISRLRELSAGLDLAEQPDPLLPTEARA